MEKMINMISLSKLNRGYAGKILEDINTNNQPTVIIKNNEPVAVIVPINLYNDMAIQTSNSPFTNLKRRHASAGSLNKYSKPELVGKEEELYHEALNEKYGR